MQFHKNGFGISPYLQERILPPLSSTEVLYVGVDGSMISTREDGWKEVKLARLFRSSDCLNPNTDNSCLSQSQYIAHFGNSKDFCEKKDKQIFCYPVFTALSNRLSIQALRSVVTNFPL